MNNNDESLEKDKKQLINSSKENPIGTVFNIESLIFNISIFLTFEEKKALYSVNKKLNSFIRTYINEIKFKKLRNSPEILKRFPNLKKLEVFGGKSANLNILKQKEMQNLENLTIRYFTVDEDLSLAISGLTELKSLVLISNEIIDIAFIKRLKNLTYLDLGNNKLNNVDILIQLPNLRSLSLQQCGLTNLHILNHKNFQCLEKLYIGMNKIIDYSFLENLVNLNTLNVYHNNLYSTEFIDFLSSKNIIELNVSENQISNFYPNLKLKNLKKLFINNNNKITNIDFLNDKYLSNLEVLDLGNNIYIENFLPLTNLKKLKKINLFNCSLNKINFFQKENCEIIEKLELGHNNEIEDYSFLSFFNNLEYLNLNYNKIADFDWLNNCQFFDKISELDLGKNTLNSIKFLKNFKNLKVLALFECLIEDISFLNFENFANLEKLNLCTNIIKDASPIKNLKKLKILKLNKNLIKDIKFLDTGDLIIEELNLASNYIKDISSLLKLEYLEIINIEKQDLEFNEKEIIAFIKTAKLIEKKVRKCHFRNQYRIPLDSYETQLSLLK